jgi:hypothetical protein
LVVHVLIGKPVSTFPGRALSGAPLCDKIALRVL